MNMLQLTFPAAVTHRLKAVTAFELLEESVQTVFSGSVKVTSLKPPKHKLKNVSSAHLLFMFLLFSCWLILFISVKRTQLIQFHCFYLQKVSEEEEGNTELTSGNDSDGQQLPTHNHSGLTQSHPEWTQWVNEDATTNWLCCFHAEQARVNLLNQNILSAVIQSPYDNGQQHFCSVMIWSEQFLFDLIWSVLFCFVLFWFNFQFGFISIIIL